MQEPEKCGVKWVDGEAICSIRGIELKEMGAVEMRSPCPSPHAYQPASYFCPVSGQQFAYVKDVSPIWDLALAKNRCIS